MEISQLKGVPVDRSTNTIENIDFIIHLDRKLLDLQCLKTKNTPLNG